MNFSLCWAVMGANKNVEGSGRLKLESATTSGKTPKTSRPQ